MAASVAEARSAVTEFAQSAGATADALAAVSLAVSEAVTNAVLHAYLDRETPGTVEVRADREDEQVVVVVADQGRGMLPRTDSPGLGLGLPLIAQMTQSLEVHDRQGGGTEIRMAFALNADRVARPIVQSPSTGLTLCAYSWQAPRTVGTPEQAVSSRSPRALRQERHRHDEPRT